MQLGVNMWMEGNSFATIDRSSLLQFLIKSVMAVLPTK